MIKRSYQQLASMLSATCSEEHDTSLNIEGVSIDSRAIQAGNLFIPIVGERFDGHDYVLEAIERGAVASLWQSDHSDPPQDVPLIFVEDTIEALQQLAHRYRMELPVRIIAVTGSNGKTTTKDMLASILATTYKTLKTEGNLNNHLGLPLTLLKLDEDDEMAVLEMGMSDRGEIKRLSEIAEPEAAIITNVGDAHLLQLGSRQNIARAKLEVLYGLKEDGLLIYNGDDEIIEETISEFPAANIKTFRFGLQHTNDYYPIAIMFEEQGCHFTFNENGHPTCYIPLLGKHNVSNALATIAISKYMGVSSVDITRGLRRIKLSGMRAEMVRGSNGVTILNDAFNSSPTALKAAIQLVEELQGYNKKIVVLGDMLELGEHERTFHENIGLMLNKDLIDYVYTYGKLAEHISHKARLTFGADRVHHMDNKEQIAEHILQISDERDLVLVKGSRGMQLEHIVSSLIGRNDMESGVE